MSKRVFHSSNATPFDVAWAIPPSANATRLVGESLVILQAVSLIADQEVTRSFPFESVCMDSECLIGHNQDLHGPKPGVEHANIVLPSAGTNATSSKSAYLEIVSGTEKLADAHCHIFS